MSYIPKTFYQSFLPAPGKPLDQALNIAVIVVFIVTALIISFVTIADPDLWGHLRFGLDILHTGQIPIADPYSYVNHGVKWINHEWLFELTMAIFYKFLGIYGLIILKGILVLSVVLLLLKFILEADLGPLLSTLFFLAQISLICSGATVLRPHLLTYLFFALLCLFLKRIEQKVDKTSWLLCFLFIPWVNSHGGYLIGLVILSVWLIAENLESIWQIQERKWLIQKWALVLSCFLVTLINPYGIGLSPFLLKATLVARPEIGEWHPISILSPTGIIYAGLLGIIITSLFLTKQKVKLSSVVIILTMAIAPLVAMRHLALYSIAATIFGAGYVRDVLIQFFGKEFKFFVNRFSKPSKIILLISLIGATIAVIIKGQQFYGQIRVKPMYVPTATISMLKDLKLTGNLANFFDWGEYIIWYVGPNIQVSSDGRRETVYTPQIQAENVAFTNGLGDWNYLLDNYPTDMALVNKSFAMYNLIKLRSDWVLVCEDEQSAFFLPAKSKYLPVVKQYVIKHAPLVSDQESFP